MSDLAGGRKTSEALPRADEVERAELLLRERLARPAGDARELADLGDLALRIDRPVLADAFAARALAVDPAYAPAHRLAGDAAGRLHRFPQALKAYDRAIALDPAIALAHVGRADAYLKIGKAREALAAAMRATTLAADSPAAWVALGRAFDHAGSHDLSAGAYAKAAAMRPDRADLAGRVLHQRLLCADWRDLDILVAAVERGLTDGQAAVDPFCWQAMSSSPASLHAVALQFERARNDCSPAPVRAFATSPDTRIRIGYVSGEFHAQATAMLMAGVYEHHDRTRFEIVGFDNGIARAGADDTMHRRLSAAFDQMIPIRDRDTDQAVDDVRTAGVDILVNLNGYFGEARNDVFRRRAAPIQVSYLGFPGTIGDGYMDYLIGDHIVIGDGDRRFYSEKVVRLPHSYQANDDRRTMARSTPGRAVHGLPASAFVFACFNNSYKILPAMMDVWAGILTRVPDSVLWLIEDSPAAARNLGREAAARGLDPARLIFAPRLPLAEHLARHAHADLFIDTLPYGAHTTASDALWSGLPLLTIFGPTFPGRVAASLLTALGLSELIAASPTAYAEAAVSLALDPAALGRIRRRLAARLRTTSLFDTAVFTGNLERAYLAMYDRHARGLAPDHIDIPLA